MGHWRLREWVTSLQKLDDSSLILKPSHPPRNPPLSFLRIDSTRLANCVKARNVVKAHSYQSPMRWDQATCGRTPPWEWSRLICNMRQETKTFNVNYSSGLLLNGHPWLERPPLNSWWRKSKRVRCESSRILGQEEPGTSKINWRLWEWVTSLETIRFRFLYPPRNPPF